MSAPTVSVVVAARNEARSIGPLLDSLERQTYDLELLDAVIADGGSTDGTADVVRRWSAGKRLRVRIIDNPGRVTASGLNAGVAASDSSIVVILGAHAEVPPDFVEASVGALARSGADCAGGVLETVGGVTPTGRAIAAATTSPFGVGNAIFRTGGAEARDVDTVAFGAYRRDVFDRIGGFDVTLVGAEDDELNFRLKRAGGRIRFEPLITARYFCRTSLLALSRQYFMYGRGKAWVLRKHRRVPSLRMLAPSAMVAGVVIGSAAAVALRRPAVVLLPVVPYLAVVGLGATRASRSTGAPSPTIAGALVTIHASYGVGLLAGLVRGGPRGATSPPPK